MKSADHSLTKFRPVLTLEQITRIADLVSQSEAEIDMSIRRVLVPLVAKIEVGAINPAYTISQIALEKRAASSERQRYENDLMSPEEAVEYERKILGV